MSGRVRDIGRLMVIAVALSLSISGPAKADLAAGQAAFERGDYQAAGAAWRPFADRGNVEGEFGIGEVEEQGNGDYKRAEYWYEKAAADGSIEARYRLAVITLSGNRDLAPDPIEGYKWALLAHGPKDEWGELAGDLLALLRQHLSIPDQAEGQRRADEWRRAHAPSTPTTDPLAELRKDLHHIDCASLKVAQVTASAAVAPPLIAPPIAPAPFIQSSSGCTSGIGPPVPCSDKPLPGFPGLPPVGSSPLASASASAMLTMPVAQDEVIVSGTVPDEQTRAAVLQATMRLMPKAKPELRLVVLPHPLCQSLSEWDDMRTAGLVSGELKAQVNGGAAVLREGDPIKVEVWTGGYPVKLRIDYFSLDGGQVLHLLPDGGDPANLAASAHEVFDRSGSGGWNVGSAPFGTEFIAVLATPQPLDLGERSRVEPAAPYLAALEAALRRGGGDAQQPNLLATMLVHTEAR